MCKMCNKIYYIFWWWYGLKKIYYYLIKTLICVCLFLVLGIICKVNINSKNYIQKIFYQDCLDFSNIKVFFDKYLGGVFPFDGVVTGGIKPVFNEDLFYQEAIQYKDGAMLKVDYNYLVPAVNGGIVVYIGKKDGYGNVVIVEGNNGIDIWYGNLCNIMVNIYDVIGDGSYLGESCDNKIYVVYSKKNEFLNYVDYLN